MQAHPIPREGGQEDRNQTKEIMHGLLNFICAYELSKIHFRKPCEGTCSRLRFYYGRGHSHALPFLIFQVNFFKTIISGYS